MILQAGRTSHTRRATRSRRGWLLTMLASGLVLVACNGDTTSTATPAATTTSSPTTSADPMETTAATTEDATAATPEEVVPSAASGFSPYTAATGEFSVDLPSGWVVTPSPDGAVAAPEAGSVDGMVMIVEAEVASTSVDDVTASLDALEVVDGEPTEVTGAVEAQRFEGETFAPFDAVAAVDADGNGAIVIAFDNGGSSSEQRDHVLTSLQFPAGG